MLSNNSDVSTQKNNNLQEDFNTAVQAIKKNNRSELEKVLKKHESNNAIFPKFLAKTDERGNTLLHLAAQYKCRTISELLIKEQLDVNTKNAAGNTPLHCVLLNSTDKNYKNSDLVNALVAAGAKLDVQNNEGQTALHLAVATGNIKLLEYLLQNDKSPRTFNIEAVKGALQGLTKFETVVEIIKDIALGNLPTKDEINAITQELQDTGLSDEEIKLVKDVIASNMPLLSIQDSQGRTALHNAVISSQMEMVKLLANKEYLEIKDIEHGRTALHYAVYDHNVTLLKHLINTGADVDATTLENYMTTLHLAVKNNNVNAVKALLDGNANVNPINNISETPLHLSVGCPDAKIMQILINSGAAPNLRNSYGLTALEVAINQQNEDAVRTLLKGGAETEIIAHPELHQQNKNLNTNFAEETLDARKEKFKVTFNGTISKLEIISRTIETPERGDSQSTSELDESVDRESTEESENLEIVANSSKLTANLNETLSKIKERMEFWWSDKDEKETIDGAINSFSYKLQNGFVDQKIYPYLRKELGQILSDIEALHYYPLTSLQMAIKSGNARICTILLQKGEADPSFKDSRNITPLEFAIIVGNAEIVKLLLQSKANPNLTTNDGTPLLSLAVNHQNPEVVDLFLKYGARIHQYASLLHDAVKASKDKKNNRDKSNSIKIIRQLIEHGAPIDDLDESIKTPLCLALRDEATSDVAMELLRLGANPVETNTFKEFSDAPAALKAQIFSCYKDISEKRGAKRQNIVYGSCEAVSALTLMSGAAILVCNILDIQLLKLINQDSALNRAILFYVGLGVTVIAGIALVASVAAHVTAARHPTKNPVLAELQRACIIDDSKVRTRLSPIRSNVTAAEQTSQARLDSLSVSVNSSDQISVEGGDASRRSRSSSVSSNATAGTTSFANCITTLKEELEKKIHSIYEALPKASQGVRGKILEFTSDVTESKCLNNFCNKIESALKEVPQSSQAKSPTYNRLVSLVASAYLSVPGKEIVEKLKMAIAETNQVSKDDHQIASKQFDDLVAALCPHDVQQASGEFRKLLAKAGISDEERDQLVEEFGSLFSPINNSRRSSISSASPNSTNSRRNSNVTTISEGYNSGYSTSLSDTPPANAVDISGLTRGLKSMDQLPTDATLRQSSQLCKSVSSSLGNVSVLHSSQYNSVGSTGASV